MPRDVDSLRDILESAHLIQRYLSGKTRDEFDQSTELQDAVVRRFEIIGEAGKRVSEQFRIAHPEIPWRLMQTMRNVMIHQYDVVDFEVVWRTAQRDVPELIRLLTPLVPND